MSSRKLQDSGVSAVGVKSLNIAVVARDCRYYFKNKADLLPPLR
jgi:hypothetical protein